MKFGKLPPKLDHRTLRMASFLPDDLLPSPDRYDVLSSVYVQTGRADDTELFPVDGNDRLGCCTVAALAHAITVYRGLLGEVEIAPERSVVDLYFKLTGGADSGLAALDVLNWWRKHEVFGDRILAYASLTLPEVENVKQAIHLFGGFYLGFNVQEDAVSDFRYGKTWTAGTNTGEGHAVFVTGYEQDTVTVLTWGRKHLATWDWLMNQGDEAYVILPPEAQSYGFADWFDFEQLQATLNHITK